MATLHSAEAVGLELSARLAQCTVALGAETDLGVKVYRGRRTIDDDMIPCVAIIEGQDEVEEHPNSRTAEAKIGQDYVMLAYLACDPQNPNDVAHKALRDMKRAIFSTDGKADRTLGAKVVRVRYLGRDIGPRADGAAMVVAALEIAVDFTENLSDP
jgi:hypothetical protein